MSDHIEEWEDEDELRASIIRRARGEGLASAYQSSLALCRDEKAPAQARSNAARTLMEIGKLELEDSDSKDVSELSPEEMQRALQKLTRDLRRRQGAFRDLDGLETEDADDDEAGEPGEIFN